MHWPKALVLSAHVVIILKRECCRSKESVFSEASEWAVASSLSVVLRSVGGCRGHSACYETSAWLRTYHLIGAMAMKQAGGGRDDLVAFYVITQVYVFFFVVASSDC
jgi:hypothetical protein